MYRLKGVIPFYWCIPFLSCTWYAHLPVQTLNFLKALIEHITFYKRNILQRVRGFPSKELGCLPKGGGKEADICLTHFCLSTVT